MLPKCVFCGDGCFQYEGDHHIVSQKVRNMMGWNGKNSGYLGQYHVPMCRRCHETLHWLQQPLLYIIKNRSVRKLRVEEIIPIVEQVQSSVTKASE